MRTASRHVRSNGGRSDNAFHVLGRTLSEMCACDQFWEEDETTDDAVRQNDANTTGNRVAKRIRRWPNRLLNLPLFAWTVAFFRNHPVAKWSVFSSGVIFLLAMGFFFWNFRFLQAHYEIKAAMASPDLREKVRLSASAAAHAPEVTAFQEIAAFFQGVEDVEDGRAARALECFSRCDQAAKVLPVEHWKNRAMQSIAFEQKNYEQFLKLAEDDAKARPKDPTALAVLASAFACKYAATGDAQFREMTEEKLQEIRRMGNALKGSNFEDRIRYRLETRDIINAKEFQRKFPNGWKSAAK
jgi:hypothetical protein